jgi:amino acid transporter
MIYIKSILVGVVAIFATTIVYLVILISVLLRRYPPPPLPPGAEVSLDLRSIINHSASFWLVAFLAFALGFYWEFRRAAR